MIFNIVLSTYVSPMRLKVSNIIRNVSVEPLIEDVPLQELVEAMAKRSVLADSTCYRLMRDYYRMSD